MFRLTAATLGIVAAKEKEGELTLQDIYGVPHAITASVYHAMLGLGWLAFILSIGCNLIFYGIHPANVDMCGIRDKIPKMPWKKRKDEENSELQDEKVPLQEFNADNGHN